MEFYNIKKADLVDFAKGEGVDVADDDTIADVDAKLVEAGYSREDYEETDASEEDEVVNEPDEPVVTVEEPVRATTEDEPKSEKVLVRMTRGNAGYTVGKYHFTKAHPFVVMDREDADRLVNNTEGFHVASAEEAERFYS